MQPNKTRADLWMDLLLVVFLIAFDVVARLCRMRRHLAGCSQRTFRRPVMRIPALAVPCRSWLCSSAMPHSAATTGVSR